MFSIVGKSDCSYCEKAKKLLDEIGIPYEYIDLYQDFEEYRKFDEEGHKTVPVIKLNGSLIGGYTELKEYLK